jgi:hypothetical protein
MEKHSKDLENIIIERDYLHAIVKGYKYQLLGFKSKEGYFKCRA